MDELMIFEGNVVDIILIDDIPHFEIYSTGMALGYVNKNNQGISYPHKSRINNTLKNAEISTSVQGVHEYMSESQLYDFMLEAGTKKCKGFRKWVTCDVLPSIRKHGAYITPVTIENIISNPDFGINLLTTLKEEREQRKALEIEVENSKSAVRFANSVSDSETTILVGELAKILNQNGIETGEKRLYEWLRENQYLIKRKGTDWNMPTQKSIEKELFEISETTITHNSGKISIRKNSKVTGTGQRYFVEKFLGESIKVK